MNFRNYRNFSRISLCKDYYLILGLKNGAQKKEIRSAYLTLAKKFHPDSPTGNTEKFKQIAEAYEILNDPRVTQASKLQQEWPEQKKKGEESKEYYNNESSSQFEDDWKGYEEWKSNKAWSYSERAENYKASGYQYYDPYLRETNRYTYSQFKKDKYNQSYKNNEKFKNRRSKSQNNEKTSDTHRNPQKDHDNVNKGSPLFVSLLSIGFITMVFNMKSSASPEIYGRKQFNKL